MKRYIVLIIIIGLMSSKGFAQSGDSLFSRNFVGAQLGGQINIGAFYERSLIIQKNLLFNGQIGIGLNISGDRESDGTNGTYSLQSGCVLLVGPRPFFFEFGPYANLNKSGSHTFSNLNLWIGLRLITKHGFFFGAGYTPIVYKSFTVSSNYGDTWVGIKLGGNF